MRLAVLCALSLLLAVMSPKNPLAGGAQAPPPTSGGSCIPPVPGPDWVCVSGNWLPPGHPLLSSSPPSSPPPTGGTGTPEPCVTVQPDPSWVCQGGGWLPPGHPLLVVSVPPAPAPPVGVPPFECATSDPFAGIPGLFGLCINGDWVPIGHPLASDYLARPLAIDYSGIYTLTLIADDCPAEVPDVVKQRVYTARVEQTGAVLHVFLSGADFLPGGNSFTGVVVSATEIRFEIFAGFSFYYYDYPYDFDLGENIAGVGPIVVFGVFKATPGIIGARMNSASSENEGVIYLSTAPSSECSISRFELMRQ